MNRVLALLTLAWLAFDSLAPAAPPLPTWNESNQKTWWAKYPTPASWPGATKSLLFYLEADYKQNGARVFSDTDFQAWLDHLRLLRLAVDAPDSIASADDLKAFIALTHDDSISHLFVEKLDPLDNRKTALKILLRLEEANAADLHEYAALGIAYSLVFDQPFPESWPHGQVARAAVPIGDLDPVKRFQFYVQSNRDHKLLQDPTRLSFDDLKYLVDSELKLSEFTYAQSNPISYSQFGDAFFSIQYSQARITNVSTVYDWPGTSYKLADIERKGGICIDQAYYAEMLGKGKGIPTIRFTGYGIDSAHAWVGYLTTSGAWELDCGRYEQQSYPKGFAVDPQTWQPIDDSVLHYLFKNSGQDPSFQSAMTALAWAHLHEKSPAYAAILDDAKSIMPEWSGTWRRQGALIDASGDVDKIKQFYQDWIAQFGNYPDTKVEGQKRLYLALKAANDSSADDVLKDIIIQNRSAGFDLGISAASDALKDKMKDKDWDGAKTIFERAIRDFGENGGLTLYTSIIYPYIKTALETGQTDVADNAIAFTEDRMTIDPDGQVGQSLRDLKNELTMQKSAASR